MSPKKYYKTKQIEDLISIFHKRPKDFKCTNELALALILLFIYINKSLELGIYTHSFIALVCSKFIVMNKLYRITLTILMLIGWKFSSSAPYFIENKGQWENQILFSVRMKGLNAWILKDKIVFDFYQSIQSSENSFRKGHVVEMTLVNANDEALAIPQKQLSGVHNYFMGNNPNAWKSNVRLFEEVVIEEVYPGIAIRYYLDRGYLKYDFILKPGADPSLIAFQITGCNAKVERKSNSLVLNTQLGEIRQKDLLTYQTYQGKTKLLESTFQLKDDIMKIDVKGRDTLAPMVIDPLIFSTFIGGEAFENLYDMTKDANGNIVFCGGAGGFGFPTTPGAYSTTAQGSEDAYVTKLSADGSELIFSTFFGGTNQDYSQGVALDANDNAYIIGTTGSNNLPVTQGAFDETYNTDGFSNNTDMFITKFNASGSSLVYSTYLGDNGMDFGRSIAVDANGNAYVTGSSKSFDFPTTTGAFDESYNGQGWNNVIVSKFNSTGSSLVYSTYVGGFAGDDATKIALGSDGSAFVTGTAYSPNFPTTPGSIKPVKSDNRDGFVFRLNPSGSALIYSTFIGGNDIDDGYSLIVDEQNNAYVTGLTISPDFPVTTGVFSSTAGNGENVFICKINPSGSAFEFSGLMGGNNRDVGHAISLGSDNTILLCGETNSLNFQVTSNAHLSSFQGIADAFIAKISQDGSELIYSSYFGGNSVEIAKAILDDGSDKIIIGGVTGGGDFPVTNGSFDNTFNTGNDPFISKISLLCQPVGLNASSNSPVCAGQDLALSGLPAGMVSYQWVGPDNFISQNQNSTVNNVNESNGGTYQLTVVDADGCEGTVSLEIEVITINNGIIQNEQGLTAIQEGSQYQWLNCENGFSQILNAQGQDLPSPGVGSFAVEINLQGCADTSDCVTIIGLDDITGNQPLIYPNPAIDWVGFKQLLGNTQLKMFDVHGRLLKNTTITTDSFQMDISDLTPGLYFIQLETSTSQLVHSKLIVR